MREHLRTLLLLFAANTISGIAQGVTLLAIPFYIVSRVEDGKFRNAVLVAIITLITLFWGLYAGTLIDRYNKKHIILSYKSVDALILMGVGGYGIWQGGLSFGWIAFVYAITIFTLNLHYPNLYAFVQALFDRRYYGKVNSMLEVQNQFTRAVGMLLGGILLEGTPDWLQDYGLAITPWSMGEVFLLDGATYALSLIFIALIRYTPSLNTGQRDRGTVIERLRQGATYLLAHRPLLLFGAASYTMFFAALVSLQLVIPVYVNDYLDTSGRVLAGFNATYAIGALVIGAVGFSLKRLNPVPQVMLLLFLGATLYATLSLTHSVAVLLMGAFVLGIANAGIRILRITYLVRSVPNRVIGRTNSFFNVINVIFRSSFSLLLTIPFFAAEENGDNIVYGVALLSAALFLSVFLIYRQRGAIQEAEG